jgi:hypothetical protein
MVSIEDPDTPPTGDDVAQIRKDYPKVFDVSHISLYSLKPFN